jgi:hypothetical protein
MARIRGCDSHARGEMLDYSIRGPLSLPYHLSLMVGLAEEVPSSKNSLLFDHVAQFYCY